MTAKDLSVLIAAVQLAAKSWLDFSAEARRDFVAMRKARKDSIKGITAALRKKVKNSEEAKRIVTEAGLPEFAKAVASALFPKAPEEPGSAKKAELRRALPLDAVRNALKAFSTEEREVALNWLKRELTELVAKLPEAAA